MTHHSLSKRIMLLASIVTLFVASVYATPVDPNRAIHVAEQFMPSQPSHKKNAKGTPQQMSEVVYTHYMPQSGRPAIYVVNINGGFALISADDVAHPVLGYNYGKPWPTNVDSIAPSVKGFLDDLAAQMEAASEHPQDAATAAEWTQPRRSPNRAPRRTAADPSLPDSVGPLLTTTWDQGQYYNAMCPMDQNAPYGYDGHVPTGCVATAMAQIIKYWGDRDTIRTRGIHSYDCNYGNLRVNYDSTSYDFAHMPNQLSAQSTQQEIDAVAKLMYECGVAVNMGYGTWESGTNIYDIRSALVNNFRFSSHIQYAEKNRMRESDWVETISKELANERPVLYSGSGNSGGHMFVCDGYKNDEFFHFNFGWNGRGDGWFLLNSISPREDMDFNSQQTALLEISVATAADTTSIYAQYSEKSIHDYFVISEPIDLYNIMAKVVYPYSNYDTYYSGHSITLIPSDTTKQLVLYIMDEVRSDVRIFDGTTTTNLLRELVNNGGYYKHIDKSPVVSTKHAITIKFESNELIRSIHFLVMEDDGCRIPTGLNISSSNGNRVFKWDSTDVSLWQVEYGEKDFTHGDGVLVESSTNSITVDNLQPLKVYDFYVRSVCDSNQYGIWSDPLTYAISQQYWTDVVTEKPNGYIEDENGDILISTAEGLAWLSRLSNDRYVSNPETYANRCVKLTADINLARYNWLPISTFEGVLDGQGHIIDSLTSMNFTGLEDVGCLMLTLNNAEVRNINMIHCNVRTSSIVAGIVRQMINSRMYNCFVSGMFISTEFHGAAIVGTAIKSQIINCAVLGTVTADDYTAGICGEIEEGKILNCYSSVRLKPRSPHLAGSICAWNPKSEVSNCYASYFQSAEYQISPWVKESYLSNLSYFIYDNNEWQTLDSIEFENVTTNNLLEVLNKGIETYNIPNLKLWESDTTNMYDGLPILSSREYIPTCPNIDSLRLCNVRKGDTCGLEISVEYPEDVLFYELQYGILVDEGSHYIDSILYDTLYSPIDTLYGLVEGNTYILKMRPFCDSIHHGAWSNEGSIVFDRPYWTDVVTSQPDGYIENKNGEIVISSAEGLAWLCSVVNGLNGQLGTDLSGKKVFLEADVNIGQYKWYPLTSGSSLLFDGQNHIIEGLYVNETEDNVGFFSTLNQSTIQNVVFENAVIMGHENAGTLCGTANRSRITNVYANSLVYAFRYVGGIIGSVDNSTINCCGSRGIVSAGYNNAAGLVSWIVSSVVLNSYSNCTVYADNVAGLLLGTTANGTNVENCYVNGILNAGFWSGGIFADTNNGGLFKNIYTTFRSDELGYLINNESPWGIICGYNYAMGAQNIYFPQGSAIPLIGTNDSLAYAGSGTYSFVDTASFDLESNIQAFSQPVTIAETSYNDLLSALNAWVDANNNEGKYLHWIADTANINGGFPILAEPTKYVVTFQYEDGTILQRDILEEGMMPTYHGVIPIKPETADSTYTFAGWMPEVVAVIGDATYTAMFTATYKTKYYTITFQDWDGTTLNAQLWAENMMPTCATPTKPATAQYTYTFAGWTPEVVAVVGEAIYTAQYDSVVNKYLVIFYDDWGNELKRDSVEYGQAATPPVLEDIPGWEFIEWSEPFDYITADLVVVAYYERPVYNIEFVNWDGTVLYEYAESYSMIPVYAGDTPTKPTTAQYTYSFIGWTPEIVAVTGDATYTAMYDSIVNQYTITFFNYDGIELQSAQVEYGLVPEYTGEAPVKPETTDSTYTFAGWMPEVVAVTEDATYVATYIALPKSVPTDLNEVDDTIRPQKVIIDNKIYILLGDKLYTIQGHEVK